MKNSCWRPTLGPKVYVLQPPQEKGNPKQQIPGDLRKGRGCCLFKQECTKTVAKCLSPLWSLTQRIFPFLDTRGRLTSVVPEDDGSSTKIEQQQPQMKCTWPCSRRAAQIWTLQSQKGPTWARKQETVYHKPQCTVLHLQPHVFLHSRA